MTKTSIDIKELAKLQRDRDKLIALESYGVDNWEGYGDALEKYSAKYDRISYIEELMIDIEAELLQNCYEPSERGAGHCATDDARGKALEVLLRSNLIMGKDDE